MLNNDGPVRSQNSKHCPFVFFSNNISWHRHAHTFLSLSSIYIYILFFSPSLVITAQTSQAKICSGNQMSLTYLFARLFLELAPIHSFISSSLKIFSTLDFNRLEKSISGTNSAKSGTCNLSLTFSLRYSIRMSPEQVVNKNKKVRELTWCKTQEIKWQMQMQLNTNQCFFIKRKTQATTPGRKSRSP